jgi:hypothetical protein
MSSRNGNVVTLAGGRAAPLMLKYALGGEGGAAELPVRDYSQL